jgi:rhodanese-related sulfurtransferase
MGEDEDGDREELPEQVDAEQARALVAGGKVLVVDVRSAEDYAEERINGSVHCDPDEVEDTIEADSSGREDILVVCEDGERSAEIAEKLREGDRQASSIDGGFSAWTGDHLPTAPNPDEEYEGPPVKLPGAVAQSEEPDEDEDDEEDAEAGHDDGGGADDEEDAEREARSSEEDDEEKPA